MNACHGPAVTVNGKPRCPGCGHRQPVNGVLPRETRELVVGAGLAGVVVAYTELRDRYRAKRVGRWTGMEAAA